MSNVLITGCSSGFGALTALTLARRGDRVFATVRRPEAALALTDLAAAENLQLSAHDLDVTDSKSVAATVQEVSALADIDVLVNNAGFALRGPVEALDDDEVAQQFDTNVIGVIRMVRAVVPGMRSRGGGTIVNLSSGAGLVGVPFEGAYSASKHAVEGLTETLRFELLAAGISVMLVEPGAYDTSFQRNIRESRGFTAEHPLRGMFKSYSEAMNSALYAGDPPDPQEVADAVIEAIDHPTGPFRRLVGKDAEMIGKLKREHSFEEFAEAIRTTLDVDLRTDSTAQQPVGS